MTRVPHPEVTEIGEWRDLGFNSLLPLTHPHRWMANWLGAQKAGAVMEAWTALSCARSRCAWPGPSQPAVAVVSPKTRARFDVFRFPWTVPISNVLLPQGRQNRSPPLLFFFLTRSPRLHNSVSVHFERTIPVCDQHGELPRRAARSGQAHS